MKPEPEIRAMLAAIGRLSEGRHWQHAAGISGAAALRWVLEEPAAQDPSTLETLERKIHEQRNGS